MHTGFRTQYGSRVRTFQHMCVTDRESDALSFFSTIVLPRFENKVKLFERQLREEIMLTHRNPKPGNRLAGHALGIHTQWLKRASDKGELLRLPEEALEIL